MAFHVGLKPVLEVVTCGLGPTLDLPVNVDNRSIRLFVAATPRPASLLHPRRSGSLRWNASGSLRWNASPSFFTVPGAERTTLRILVTKSIKKPLEPGMFTSVFLYTKYTSSFALPVISLSNCELFSRAL